MSVGTHASMGGLRDCVHVRWAFEEVAAAVAAHRVHAVDVQLAVRVHRHQHLSDECVGPASGKSA